MKTVLVTAFEPFGGDKLNPTQMVLERLPAELSGCALIKLLLPVEFVRSRKMACEAYDRLRPDAVVMLGLAGTRDAVTPETTGRNLMKARIPDNAGYEPQDEPVVPDGPETLSSTFPVEKIVEAVRAKGIPARASDSAGLYVCNSLLYSMLHHNGGAVPTGFIHVPALPEQAADSSKPSMPLEQIVTALEAAVRACGE